MEILGDDENNRILQGIEVIPSLQQQLILGNFRELLESLGAMTSLQTVIIIWCVNLRSLPNSFQHHKNLHRLIIYKCPMLEKRCKKGTRKDWKKIAHVTEFNYMSE
jgi:hypothetical protein